MVTKKTRSPDKPRPTKAEIHAFAIANTEDHPTGLARVVASQFRLSRQTANRHLHELVDAGILQADGRTKARRYSLVTRKHMRALEVTPKLEEGQLWRSEILPHLRQIKTNVLDICQHGFTEMVNNVIDHSESIGLMISVQIDPLNVKIVVIDVGVGIFEKIRSELGLEDPRHALLELSKGKLTTDADKHTGEGIYFTSRMFDEFSISSGTLFFRRVALDHDQWLIETEERIKFDGTGVSMAISLTSNRTSKEVFDAASLEDDDLAFRRTHVPIKLARYPEEQLVSRSQAKRVLARFDRFDEVMLDFSGVEQIGQAFADEIFRVFRDQHPEIRLIAINTDPEVEQMIDRVSTSRSE